MYFNFTYFPFPKLQWPSCCRFKLIKAGSGRSHTVVVSEDGQSLAFGWNKHGQLGSGSVKNGRFNFFKFIFVI